MKDLILEYPEALLLVVPASMAWWWLARDGAGRWWRALGLLLLVIAAARPSLRQAEMGADVIVVLDRSLSMGDARAAQQELIELIADQRESSDRLGVVVFGDGAQLAQGPRERGLPKLAELAAVPDGASSMSEALQMAGALVPPGRTARLVVHSDGETTGSGLRTVIAELAGRGIVVDVVRVERAPLPDAAVLRIDAPDSLRLGESFLATARFSSDGAGARKYTIKRNGRLLTQGTVELGPRPVTVTFADRPSQPGVARYTVTLDAAADAVPQNNQTEAFVQVLGGERILVVGGAATKAGNVARAAEAAGFEAVSVPAGPVTLGQLMGYDAVVLEQVPAEELTLAGMEAVARWVSDFGGGLLFTGGPAGFGAGGYHKSPVERVLPVSMELRDQNRRLGAALAVALDRSGSMMAEAGRGQTKMDLANAGTVAAVELLSPIDEIAVYAVDVDPHEIIPLQRVRNKSSLVGKVKDIESTGGGIYVYNALVAAGRALLGSDRATRHLVLFADADDAEEPGDYVKLLADYRAAGITVSVIGLGTDKGMDAQLLKDVARLGGGRVHFAAEAKDLPRVFAQETVLMAQTSWNKNPVRLKRQAELARLLPAVPELAGEWPEVGGYNVNWAKDRAMVLATAPGDPTVPAVAAWWAGTGRAVSMAFDIDGKHSGGLLDWSGYAPLMSSLLRWTAGADAADMGALYAERDGRNVALRLELDPEQRDRWPAQPPVVKLIDVKSPDTEPRTVTLLPVDNGVYEGRYTLADAAAVIPVTRLVPAGSRQRGRAIVGPVTALPYHPEFEPRTGRAGGEILADLAVRTGGVTRADVTGVFDIKGAPLGMKDMSVYVLALALLVLFAEIAVRRLGLRLPRLSRGKRTAGLDPARPPPAEPSPLGVALAARAKVAPASTAPVPDAVAEEPRVERPSEPRPTPGDEPPTPPNAGGAGGLSGALSQLKKGRRR